MYLLKRLVAFSCPPLSRRWRHLCAQTCVKMASCQTKKLCKHWLCDINTTKSLLISLEMCRLVLKGCFTCKIPPARYGKYPNFSIYPAECLVSSNQIWRFHITCGYFSWDDERQWGQFKSVQVKKKSNNPLLSE